MCVPCLPGEEMAAGCTMRKRHFGIGSATVCLGNVLLGNTGFWNSC